MYDGQIRTVVALIILVGHFLVFAAGGMLGFFGPLRGTDLAQVVLIASPVLAVTATAAFRFLLAGQYGVAMGDKVTTVFAILVIAYPTVLILCIFGLFYAAYITLNGFGPDNLKVALGALETFFGGFIGLISDKLFGPLKPAPTPPPPPGPVTGPVPAPTPAQTAPQPPVDGQSSNQATAPVVNQSATPTTPDTTQG